MENNFSELGMTDEQLFTIIDHNDLESEKITAPRYSYWKSVFRVFFKKRINIVLLVILAVVLLMAYIYPVFFGYDRYGNLADQAAKHLTPSKAFKYFGPSIRYIFGTGASGQSTFDAIWSGSRVSLSLSFVCAAINMTVGIIVGAVWGFSKKVDAFMMEVYNVVANIPTLILVAVLMMLFTANFWTLVFALTATGWLFIAYSMRIQVIIIRDREYNLASKCLGTSTMTIAMKNILPFMTSVIMTILAAEIPSYISMEVYLAYIGFSISDTTLGKLISNAQSAMVTPGWEFEFWTPVIVAAIITVVLYVVGQNLGDASDPRTHM